MEVEFNRDEIDRLMKFATGFARRKLAKLPYIGINEEDVAQSAWIKLVAAVRTGKWSPRVCKPEAYLCMCIKHEIDATLRRLSTFGEVGYPDNVINIIEAPQSRPDQVLEEQQSVQELLDYITARSPAALPYAKLILDHSEKLARREVASLMNVDPSHIDYLKRVLRPILAEFLAQYSNSDSPARRLLKSTHGE